MQIKIDITKKFILKLAIIIAVLGSAVLLDVYFDGDPVKLENIQAESKGSTNDLGGVYLIAQTNSTGAKTSIQKTQIRYVKVQLHDKFLRKYHQVRNYQVLKAEVQTQTAPIIQSYHYLIFQNYFFTQPDEDSLS